MDLIASHSLRIHSWYVVNIQYQYNNTNAYSVSIILGSTNNTNKSPFLNFAMPGDSPPAQKLWGQIHEIPTSGSPAITVSGRGPTATLDLIGKNF